MSSIPLLTYATLDLALGIMTCYFSGKPNADFFVGTATRVALAYSTVGIAMNVTLSALIVGRILWMSRKMEKTLGHKASKPYTGAVAIVIESMLPYTLFGVAYVATLGASSPTSILFLSIYVMFTVSILLAFIWRRLILNMTLLSVCVATNDHITHAYGTWMDGGND